jgi:hypothetical protein
VETSAPVTGVNPDLIAVGGSPLLQLPGGLVLDGVQSVYCLSLVLEADLAAGAPSWPVISYCSSFHTR